MRIVPTHYGRTAVAVDTVSGRSVWVQRGDCRVASADLVADLYAAVGQGWLGQGRFDHFVVVDADDTPLLDAW